MTITGLPGLSPREPHEFDRDADQPSWAPEGGYCRCGWIRDARCHLDRDRCGESDGTRTCVIRPGDHDPASNYPDGPVRHVAADGSRWTGPMSAGEAAMAREV